MDPRILPTAEVAQHRSWRLLHSHQKPSCYTHLPTK
jgi:hypothetical protein